MKDIAYASCIEDLIKIIEKGYGDSFKVKKGLIDKLWSECEGVTQEKENGVISFVYLREGGHIVELKFPFSEIVCDSARLVGFVEEGYDFSLKKEGLLDVLITNDLLEASLMPEDPHTEPNS